MPDLTHPITFFISHGNDRSLQELRDVCVEMTWQAGHSPRAFLSSLAGKDSRREIERCDVFVRLFADVDETLKTVKEECFWAADRQKPILLLAVGECPFEIASKKLLEKVPAGSAIHSVSPEPYVFAKDYLLAMHQVVRLADAASRQGAPSLRSSDLSINNRFWRRFVMRVNQWAVLDSRFNTNAALKQASAEFFWDLYLGILSKGLISRLFFESGSAVAFLSEALAGRLDQVAFAQWGAQIESNNVISYMEFILSQFGNASLYPSGPPERKYGGTFGELANLSVPAEGDHPITGRAYEWMCHVRDHFAEQYTDLGIIFGAFSGIDLRRGSEKLGPHVGSYHNMLFKRALLESGAPLVVFLDEDKFTPTFTNGQCFCVCDEEFSWPYACRNVPLAIVCAFRSEERAREVLTELEYFGLDHPEKGRLGEAPWPVIASNDLFWRRRQQWRSAALDQSNLEALRID